MGFFAGNIDGIRQDINVNIYEILFKDGGTEEWCQEKYDNNYSNACIPSGNVEFRFINKFSDGCFFSGRVVGVQYNDKRKCKFDEDGDIHNYILYRLKYYSTNHTAV